MKLLATSVFMAGFIASTCGAVAQGRPLVVRPLGYDYPETGTPVDALPTPFSHGGSCVKACDRDNMPCDPDNWKVADRRCNYNQKG